MITDKDTNIVYFSELLKTEGEFALICNRITDILDKYQIQYDFLKGTKDIWARDYMPIQKGVDDFVQFRYEPSYLKDLLHTQSDPKVVCTANSIKPNFSTINLDGGNVVKWDNKVMITDRIYSENPEYTDNAKLVNSIESLLETKIIIIPQIKSDFTGHADGLVRFINDNTVLGNDLNFEFDYWTRGMKKVLEKYGLEYSNMPMFDYKDNNYPDSAIGCYINYLEIGNLIIFPIFDVSNNKDKQAVDLVKSVYPNKQIETININDIARHGGLMNCITWNIKA